MAVKLIAIHRGDTADQTVSGSVLDEIIKFSPLSLGSEHKWAVLDKRTLVDEIFNIFTRSAMSSLSPTLHRCRPSHIETDRVSLNHL
jgi:hypothetical protein